MKKNKDLKIIKFTTKEDLKIAIIKAKIQTQINITKNPNIFEFIRIY